MVLDFKVERLFVEKQVTFLFLPFSAARTDGTTSPPQRKKQTKTSHAIHTILKLSHCIDTLMTCTAIPMWSLSLETKVRQNVP